MKLSDKVKNLTGVLVVEIQGFFTERFINLCRINNVKIFEIRNIVNGVVRFKIHISNFKKLKPIARKTKCRVKIKSKKGIYFSFFKYRKRKILGYLVIFLLLLFILSTSFIWNIKILGNDRIDEETINAKLKQSGIYIGRIKLGMNKNDILKQVRAELPDISWMGLEIKGTVAEVKIVEKVILDDKHIQDNRIGDIVSTHAGVITRIIAENGTAIFKEGSYVEKDSILIKGKIYSDILGEEFVHAKGIIRINTDYLFEKDYKFVDIKKEYVNKKRYTIGFSLNSKEIYINYLNNRRKYDKLKSSKYFSLFGFDMSFDLYTFNEFIEKEVSNTKDDIINIAYNESQIYIEDIIKETDSSILVDEKEEIIETNESITYRKVFTINQRVGKFIERTNDNVTYNY